MATSRTERYAARLGKTAEELTPRERAAARGHEYTPEHGKGALQGISKTTEYAGRTMKASYSDREIERNINRAADRGQRVQVWAHDKTTDTWKVAGGQRGYSASYVAREVAGAGGLRGAVVNSFGAATGDNYDMPENEEDIDAWQLDIMEV